jgi:hypothetical protein
MRSSLRAWTPRDSRLKLKLRGQSLVIKGIERSIYPLGWVGRDAANCGCNLITPPCDETVTGSHQILHTSSRRPLCDRNTKPIHCIRRSPLSALPIIGKGLLVKHDDGSLNCFGGFDRDGRSSRSTVERCKSLHRRQPKGASHVEFIGIYKQNGQAARRAEPEVTLRIAR